MNSHGDYDDKRNNNINENHNGNVVVNRQFIEIADLKNQIFEKENVIRKRNTEIYNLNEKTLDLDNKLKKYQKDLQALTTQMSASKNDFFKEMSLKDSKIKSLEDELAIINLKLQENDRSVINTVSKREYNLVINDLIVLQKDKKNLELENKELKETISYSVSSNDDDDDDDEVDGDNDTTTVNIIDTVDWKILKREVIKERTHRLKLQKTLCKNVIEMENQIPKIMKDEKTILELNEKLNQSNLLLESYINSQNKDELDKQTQDKKLKEYETSIKMLQQQRLDLASQVQCLLFASVSFSSKQIISDEDIQFVKKIIKNQSHLNSSTSSSIQSTISKNLVLFKNIQIMQENNENLILALRTLGEKLEERDDDSSSGSSANPISNETDEQDQILENATKAIKSLKDTNDSLLLQIDALNKEKEELLSKKVSSSERQDSNTSIKKNEIDYQYTKQIQKLNDDYLVLLKGNVEITVKYENEINNRKLVQEQKDDLINLEIPALKREIQTLNSIIKNYSSVLLEKDTAHNKTIMEIRPMVEKLASQTIKVESMKEMCDKYDQLNRDKSKMEELLTVEKNRTMELSQSLETAEKNSHQRINALNDQVIFLQNELETLKSQENQTQVLAKINDLQNELNSLMEKNTLLEKSLESLTLENKEYYAEIIKQKSKIQIETESNDRWKQQCTNLEQEKTVSLENLNGSIQQYEDKFTKLKQQAHQKLNDYKLQNTEIIKNLNETIAKLNEEMTTLSETKQNSVENESLEEFKQQLQKDSQEKIEMIKRKSKEEIKQQIDKRREELEKSFDKFVDVKVSEQSATTIKKLTEDFENEKAELKKKTIDETERRLSMKIKILENKVSNLNKKATPGLPPSPFASATLPLANPFGLQNAPIAQANPSMNAFGKRPFETATTGMNNNAFATNSTSNSNSAFGSFGRVPQPESLKKQKLVEEVKSYPPAFSVPVFNAQPATQRVTQEAPQPVPVSSIATPHMFQPNNVPVETVDKYSKNQESPSVLQTSPNNNSSLVNDSLESQDSQTENVVDENKDDSLPLNVYDGSEQSNEQIQNHQDTPSIEKDQTEAVQSTQLLLQSASPDVEMYSANTTTNPIVKNEPEEEEEIEKGTTLEESNNFDVISTESANTQITSVANSDAHDTTDGAEEVPEVVTEVSPSPEIVHANEIPQIGHPDPARLETPEINISENTPVENSEIMVIEDTPVEDPELMNTEDTPVQEVETIYPEDLPMGEPENEYTVEPVEETPEPTVQHELPEIESVEPSRATSEENTDSSAALEYLPTAIAEMIPEVAPHVALDDNDVEEREETIKVASLLNPDTSVQHISTVPESVVPEVLPVENVISIEEGASSVAESVVQQEEPIQTNLQEATPNPEEQYEPLVAPVETAVEALPADASSEFQEDNSS